MKKFFDNDEKRPLIWHNYGPADVAAGYVTEELGSESESESDIEIEEVEDCNSEDVPTNTAPQ